MQALERWERTLDAILAGQRRRLSGPEYVALIDEVDRAGDAREVRKIAMRLAEKLARHDGAGGETRFGDPAMTRAYEAARKRYCGELQGDATRPLAAPPAARQGHPDELRAPRRWPT